MSLTWGAQAARNELWPMTTAIQGLRARTAAAITVFHSDLPGNDWPALFDTVYDSPDSYLTEAEAEDVFAFATGRTAYDRTVPAGSLMLGWSAITLHWMSNLPTVIPDQVYSGLVPPEDAAPLRERSRYDWESFLANRAIELVPGGQLVLVVGASAGPGKSGAEGLFAMITELVADFRRRGRLSGPEADHIFYPTWNRTPAEFLEPLQADFADSYRLHEHGMTVIDDADSYPQFRDHGDADGFAAAYVTFVRAVTEPSFFRWLSPDRDTQSRADVVESFYRELTSMIAADPATATCHWHTYVMRLERAD